METVIKAQIRAKVVAVRNYVMSTTDLILIVLIKEMSYTKQDIAYNTIKTGNVRFVDFYHKAKFYIVKDAITQAKVRKLIAGDIINFSVAREKNEVFYRFLSLDVENEKKCATNLDEIVDQYGRDD